jgi:hypothetical protein
MLSSFFGCENAMSAHKERKRVGISIKENNILSYESFFAPLLLKHNIMELSS